MMMQLAFAWAAGPCIGLISQGAVPKRSDAQQLHAYFQAGGYAPVREVEVYARCIRDGESLSQAAASMGVGFETVRNKLRRLRHRVRNPHQHRRTRARIPQATASV